MGTRLQRLQETFGLDLRSLGILRMLIGGMLLVDLAIRAISLRAHYTDEGVLPVSANLRELVGHPGRFSFHMEGGDLGLQVMLFSAAGLAAVTLIVGFHTRLSLLASFVLLISVQNRNFEIETGGDYLLRLICMWGLFLPLGARFSLDARVGRGVPHRSSPAVWGNQYFSVATIAVLVQMFIVYFFSALHKNHVIWRESHLAIHYALHIDAYDTTLGGILREIPWLTKILTRATLGFEFVAPWAIGGAGLISLLPRMHDTIEYQGPLRTGACVAFILFHLGLGMTLSLGTFAWFAMLVWVGLFPSYAWDQLAAWRRGERIFVIDEQETPPNKGTQKKGKAKRSQKEDAETSAEPIVRPAWALTALARLERWARAIETPTNGKVRVPGPLLQHVRRVSRWGADVGATVLLFYTLLWNLRTLEPRPYGDWILGRGDSLLPNATKFLNFVRLDQHWGLFAPYPRTTDGYYVVLGKTKSGAEIDYLRPDFRLTWEKPDDVSGSYETFRWRKYFRNIRRTSKRQNLRLYSDYVCRTYNGATVGRDPLQQVEIYFMQRKTKPTPGHFPTEKQRLWRQLCRPDTPAAPSR